MGLRRVAAGDLRPHPGNWRRHPESQRAALASMLESVGLVDAVIARETPTGLELVDGHLRADMLAGDTVPVLVVDLDDDEAAAVLATLDPLAAMAVADDDALAALIAGAADHAVASLAAIADAPVARSMPDGNALKSDPNDEAYTPEWIIAAARMVMGGIDLDPASCAAAQEVVRADRWVGLPDDGLDVDWAGRVWLNPPWSAKRPWVEKLLDSASVDQWAVCMSLDLTSTGPRVLAEAAAAVWVPRRAFVFAGPGDRRAGWWNHSLFFGGRLLAVGRLAELPEGLILRPQPRLT